MGIDYLSHLRADSARFREVMTRTEPDAPVPTCDGWTAADLLWHLGEVQHFFGTIVHDRMTAADGYQQPERPDSYSALLDFFDASSRLLIDALAGAADDVAVWTWLDTDQSVGFVRRRQAHEALIHRLDAELTANSVTDLDVELATDGVLEAVEWMFGEAPSWATEPQYGPVGLLATTDSGASWLVQVGRWSGTSPNSGKTYTDEGVLRQVSTGDPQFSITGPARDLDAWMWNRPTLSEIELSGDTAAFEAVIRAGVQ